MSRWWWIGVVVVLVAGLVVWTVARRSERGGLFAGPGGDAGTAPTAQADGTGSDPVADYLQFASTPVADQLEPALADPEVVADGLRKLAGALGTLGIAGPELPVDLRVAAEHVLLNPDSPATAETTRRAFVSAADVIHAASAEGEATLQQLAGSLSADTSVLEQRAAVYEFLRAAADAIRRLSNAP